MMIEEYPRPKSTRHWNTTTGPICPAGHSLSRPDSFVRGKRGIRRCVRCYAARLARRNAAGPMPKRSESRYRAAAQLAATRASALATSPVARCVAPLLAIALAAKGG
jgi:hypothetical protein